MESASGFKIISILASLSCFSIFSNNFVEKRLFLWDSNLDRWSRRRAFWPPVTPNHNIFNYVMSMVQLSAFDCLQIRWGLGVLQICGFEIESLAIFNLVSFYVEQDAELWRELGRDVLVTNVSCASTPGHSRHYSGSSGQKNKTVSIFIVKFIESSIFYSCIFGY